MHYFYVELLQLSWRNVYNSYTWSFELISSSLSMEGATLEGNCCTSLEELLTVVILEEDETSFCEVEFGGPGKSLCNLGGSFGIGNLICLGFWAKILLLVIDWELNESRELVEISERDFREFSGVFPGIGGNC